MEGSILEWMGWMSFFIILCYSAYPGKVKRLEGKVKKLEKKNKGENVMSQIIKELLDKTCKITTSGESAFDVSADEVCTVLAVDDEWIKFTSTDKKNHTKTQIMRIEDIDHIELLAD